MAGQSCHDRYTLFFERLPDKFVPFDFVPLRFLGTEWGQWILLCNPNLNSPVGLVLIPGVIVVVSTAVRRCLAPEGIHSGVGYGIVFQTGKAGDVPAFLVDTMPAIEQVATTAFPVRLLSLLEIHVTLTIVSICIFAVHVRLDNGVDIIRWCSFLQLDIECLFGFDQCARYLVHTH